MPSQRRVILFLSALLVEFASSKYGYLKEREVYRFNRKSRSISSNESLTKALGSSISDSEFSSSEEDTGGSDESSLQPSFLTFGRTDFVCPLVKRTYLTGVTAANVSPEDIYVIAAIGDSVSTGRRLFLSDRFNYYGATFSTGGDATLVDIVTIPNLLKNFNENLGGASHGSKPYLNFAAVNASYKDIPEQAKQFVEKLKTLFSNTFLKEHWVMLFITIGTDQVCRDCSGPNHNILFQSLRFVIQHVRRLFVVLVGPLYVSTLQSPEENLLTNYCDCLKNKTRSEITSLYAEWKETFLKIERAFGSSSYSSFGVRAIPVLSIAHESPEKLLAKGWPLLNRLGHEHAANWLWNTLLTSSKRRTPLRQILYNSSFLCPAARCPYFRLPANEDCELVTLEEAEGAARRLTTTVHPAITKRRRALQRHLALVIVVIVVSALISVIFFGTIFYRHGIKATKSRFEAVPGV